MTEHPKRARVDHHNRGLLRRKYLPRRQIALFHDTGQGAGQYIPAQVIVLIQRRYLVFSKPHGTQRRLRGVSFRARTAIEGTGVKQVRLADDILFGKTVLPAQIRGRGFEFGLLSQVARLGLAQLRTRQNSQNVIAFHTGAEVGDHFLHSAWQQGAHVSDTVRIEMRAGRHLDSLIGSTTGHLVGLEVQQGALLRS